GTPRLSALHCGFFRTPGHAFGGARAAVSQLLAGGSVLSPRWSPGPPCTGMPAGCGSRVSSPTSGCRRRYQSRISGPFLRPAPLSRRLMTAPLDEQGAGIIGEVFRAGINYFPRPFFLTILRDAMLRMAPQDEV